MKVYQPIDLHRQVVLSYCFDHYVTFWKVLLVLAVLFVVGWSLGATLLTLMSLLLTWDRVAVRSGQHGCLSAPAGAAVWPQHRWCLIPMQVSNDVRVRRLILPHDYCLHWNYYSERDLIPHDGFKLQMKAKAHTQAPAQYPQACWLLIRSSCNWCKALKSLFYSVFDGYS